MSSRFSSNSEAPASELLGNREEIFPHYWQQLVIHEHKTVCMFPQNVPLRKWLTCQDLQQIQTLTQ